jgi:hypothetical protein
MDQNNNQPFGYDDSDFSFDVGLFDVVGSEVDDDPNTDTQASSRDLHEGQNGIMQQVHMDSRNTSAGGQSFGGGQGSNISYDQMIVPPIDQSIHGLSYTQGLGGSQLNVQTMIGYSTDGVQVHGQVIGRTQGYPFISPRSTIGPNIGCQPISRKLVRVPSDLSVGGLDLEDYKKTWWCKIEGLLRPLARAGRGRSWKIAWLWQLYEAGKKLTVEQLNISDNEIAKILERIVKFDPSPSWKGELRKRLKDRIQNWRDQIARGEDQVASGKHQRGEDQVASGKHQRGEDLLSQEQGSQPCKKINVEGVSVPVVNHGSKRTFSDTMASNSMEISTGLDMVPYGQNGLNSEIFHNQHKRQRTEQQTTPQTNEEIQPPVPRPSLVSQFVQTIPGFVEIQGSAHVRILNDTYIPSNHVEITVGQGKNTFRDDPVTMLDLNPAQTERTLNTGQLPTKQSTDEPNTLVNGLTGTEQSTQITERTLGPEQSATGQSTDEPNTLVDGLTGTDQSTQITERALDREQTQNPERSATEQSTEEQSATEQSTDKPNTLVNGFLGTEQSTQITEPTLDREQTQNPEPNTSDTFPGASHCIEPPFGSNRVDARFYDPNKQPESNRVDALDSVQGRAVRNQSLPDRSLPDRSLPDRSLPDRSLPDRSLLDQSDPGQPLTEQLLSDHNNAEFLDLHPEHTFGRRQMISDHNRLDSCSNPENSSDISMHRPGKRRHCDIHIQDDGSEIERVDFRIEQLRSIPDVEPRVPLQELPLNNRPANCIRNLLQDLVDHLSLVPDIDAVEVAEVLHKQDASWHQIIKYAKNDDRWEPFKVNVLYFLSRAAQDKIREIALQSDIISRFVSDVKHTYDPYLCIVRALVKDKIHPEELTSISRNNSRSSQLIYKLLGHGIGYVYGENMIAWMLTSMG